MPLISYSVFVYKIGNTLYMVNTKDPQLVTGCPSTTHFVQITLTPKKAGLVLTFLVNDNLT